jgi:hypothetical protein
MDTTSIIILSVCVNIFFAVWNVNTRAENVHLKKLLGKDKLYHIPSSKELLRVYDEKKFIVYFFFSLLPFCEKLYNRIIDKGKEGLKLTSRKHIFDKTFL